ncbi:hydroxymethylglutaryl-CoA lyase [Solicola gregarius]|uniref:Hydroxymethylglutaryl-CoA lyase n=1 Tax=Solicola gregarius TaxID=2908642 RepID=A0AA46YKK3_9ACTN|nr:hydroxymethylglutaryl-CoA lyase [Solicola gregarius]UYM04664.1 hydroxymethylglutaryl-CoA lyase [Solicola gregarius]
MQILEVAPRDGLQNESTQLSTDDKVELVARAVSAGARRVEVTSFVHPKAVPQLADAEDVMARVERVEGVRYAGLVMNERGLDRAVAAGVDEVDIVVVASDTFCQRNQNMTTWQACDVAAGLVSRARDAGLFTTVTIGASFGCPFEGDVPVARLREVVLRVVDARPDELALADTIGVAVPSDIIDRAGCAIEVAGPQIGSRLHLHDTRNTAIANAVAALEVGVETLDASIGGAGGCPFAPNATGNVATEDLAYLFGRMGVDTGLDLDSLIDSAVWLEERLGKELPSALARAGGFPPA